MMKNLRIMLSSFLLAAILLTVLGLKSVEGQQDSSGHENAMVEGSSWRDTAATTQEILETGGRNKRYLVQNCVVDVSSSSSMSIVSQLSTTDEEKDDGEKEGRRRTTSGLRNTGSTTCTVEVVTTSTASISTVSAPPLSPVEDSLSDQDRDTKTDREPKIKEDRLGKHQPGNPKGAIKSKTKGPKASKGPKVSKCFGNKTKGPRSKSVSSGMKILRRDLKGSSGGGKDSKTKAPKKTCSPSIPTENPTDSPTFSPTSCIPDDSLCQSCINNFQDLQGNVSAGGQIYICDNTNITVNQQLTFTSNTTISCCKNCEVGLESTCVLEQRFEGDMIVGDFSMSLSTVRFELQRMVLDANFAGGGYAVKLFNADFFLTDSVVENFESTYAVIGVYGGSITAISSVIQNNSSPRGAVDLFNSNGRFQSMVFSTNVAKLVNFGGAVSAEGTATVTFFDSTFQMNMAFNQSDRDDIGVVDDAFPAVTVTCDNATICNSNPTDPVDPNQVFIDGPMAGFMNECPLTPVACPV